MLFSVGFGGRFRGVYASDSSGKRDYVKEAKNNALKQSKKLSGIKFVNCSYNELSIPSNSLIYCDPPYYGTTSYSDLPFNHTDFWQWCRDMFNKGHIVYISEYTAPDDFECVWEKQVMNQINNTISAKSATEKLFKYKG